MVFSVGFERCKIISPTHLLVDSVKLLQFNFLDESLKAVTVDSIEKFARASRYFTEANKVDVAIQIEVAASTEEGYSRASCSNDALGW